MKLKKTLKILLISIIALLPLSAKADVGMPEMRPYEVYITNTEGAICHNWDESETDEKIAYDENKTYFVNYEVKIHGKLYGSVSEERDNYDTSCFVNSEDYKPKDYKFISSEYTETMTKYYVWESGLTLKKGPAEVYKNVSNDEIPVGTILTVKYVSDELWGYVIYQGQAGWIRTYQLIAGEEDHSSVANVLEEKTKLINFNDELKLYDSPVTGYGKVVGTVPSGANISYQYRFGMVHTFNVLINYNGVSGWTHIGDEDESYLLEEVNQGVYIVDSSKIKLYDKPINGKEVSNVKLENNKEYKLRYYTSYEFYDDDTQEAGTANIYGIETGTTVSYFKYIQFYDDNYENIPVLNSNLSYYTVTDEIETYDSFESNAKKLNTIKKGSTIAVYYSKHFNNEIYDYVKGYGWFKETNSNLKRLDETKDRIPSDVIGMDKDIVEPTTTRSIEPTTKKADDKKEKSEASKLTLKELIIVIMAGVLVVILTAIVVLILVNKKKKKKAGSVQPQVANSVQEQMMTTPVAPVQTQEQVVMPQVAPVQQVPVEMPQVATPEQVNNGSDNNANSSN